MGEVRIGEAKSSDVLDVANRTREADHPHSLVVQFDRAKPLKLDCGRHAAPFQIAYQTYGTLNAERSNAILVCHALTGDQYVAERASGDRQARLVGDRWSAPASRSIPSAISSSAPTCSAAAWASTGPASTNPATGQP